MTKEEFFEKWGEQLKGYEFADGIGTYWLIDESNFTRSILEDLAITPEVTVTEPSCCSRMLRIFPKTPKETTPEVTIYDS